MDPDRDNFEQLRRLLALKRHEQPPPGYFQTFSSHVLVQIRAGQTAPLSWWQRFMGETPWFDRIFGGLEIKPAFAGAMSFAVCGLIATGLFYAETPSSANVGAVSGMWQASGDYVVSQPAVMPATNSGFLVPPALRANFMESQASSLGTPHARNLKFTY